MREKNIEGENSQLSCKGGSREQDRQREMKEKVRERYRESKREIQKEGESHP